MHASRRQFIQSGVAGLGLLAAARPARSADAEITVLVNEPIATINPNVHGHFTENIGGVIYDGLWVGRDSKVPNEHGIRRALVEAFRKIDPPVVRWPGGCFADSYDWHDGIGKSDRRPTRTNFWIDDPDMRGAPDGPQKYDPNEFGTHEFMEFCHLTGAKPYFAANLRSLPAKDFYQWVEYCNAPRGKSSLARLRGENGDPEPFNVQFWGVGNEAWGCGGNFRPAEYAEEFRRFTAWVPQYGSELSLIASGPNGDDVSWTRGFFEALTDGHPGAIRDVFGWSTHYYCGTAGKGQAVDFTESDWYELLYKARRMEQIIGDHWQAMGQVDRERRVKLVVDEWGAWHKRGTEVDPTYLFGQMPTMRDALITGLTLDIFHQHADKVAMANAAQLVNNLHCLFLAKGPEFLLTPTYHVFAMYAAHKGGESLRTLFDSAIITAPTGKDNATGPLPLLAGSASRHGQQVVLSVVNSSAKDAQAAQIRMRGAAVRSVKAKVLAASDIHAHNTFAEPAAVKPDQVDVAASGSSFTHQFPKASVTVMEIEVG